MDEARGNGAAVIATIAGFVIGLLTYLLVAPFSCDRDGSCHGLVAFNYEPGSAGHWQALGAGALVGAVVAMLLWLAMAAGRVHSIARMIATPLLVVGVGISLLSQSVLFVLGPLVGGLVLWLMWSSGGRSRHAEFSEPGPFHSRE